MINFATTALAFLAIGSRANAQSCGAQNNTILQQSETIVKLEGLIETQDTNMRQGFETIRDASCDSSILSLNSSNVAGNEQIAAVNPSKSWTTTQQ